MSDRSVDVGFELVGATLRQCPACLVDLQDDGKYPLRAIRRQADDSGSPSTYGVNHLRRHGAEHSASLYVQGEAINGSEDSAFLA